MAQQQDYTGAHNDDALQRAIDFITSDYYQHNDNWVQGDLECGLDADHYWHIRNHWHAIISQPQGLLDWCKRTINPQTGCTLADALYQVMFLCKYAGLQRHYIKYQAQTGQIDEQQQLVELLAV
jgi:hypothetical protein